MGIPRVAIVVRTWHKDLDKIVMLLQSIAIFWPFGAFQSTVVVVLDLEAPETVGICNKLLSKFGRWVNCIGEELPDALANSPYLRRPKFARVMLSTFWADHYVGSGTDYVAVIDSDVVFHSFGAETLLFAAATRHNRSAASAVAAKLQPVINGLWSPTFSFSVLAVQDEYLGINFMDTMPMVIRREDFMGLRQHIIDRFGLLSGRRGISFNEAFVLAE